VSLDTIERCAEAGADVFVAGSAVFKADDPNAMIESLRSAASASAPS
jgi:ribulose-phosphate 3-epimerase